MANDLTKNPWVIDTPSATNLTTVWTDVRGIRWVAPSSVAGNEANVQDQNGNVIFRSLATGANTSVSEAFEASRYGKHINGLRVPTLDSGIIYIDFYRSG